MKYFSSKLSAGFVAIYSGRMILTVSGQLFGLFLPIFLYQLFGFNLIWVLAYYFLRDGAYFLSLPFGCRFFMNRLGLRDSLRLAVVLGSVFYLCFYIIQEMFGLTQPSFEGAIWIMSILGVNLIILTLFRLNYWVPLHTDITKFTNKRDRAKQLSLMAITQVVLGASMPLLAGWILNYYNYGVLFLLGTLIYLLALIPFAKLPEVAETFSWSYGQTFKEFVSSKRQKMISAYVGDGAESIVGLVIWPIFIWELLEGNYFEVGVISSLIVVVTVVLQFVAGKYIDKGDKGKMLKYGSGLYAIGWIFKIFITTAFQIFIASTYHNLVRVFARTSFDTLNYEMAADQGHYVDEYTVLREMAVSLGRMLMSLLVAFLILNFNLEWSFILAALAALTMNFLAGVGDAEEEKRISKKLDLKIK
ncbi:MAG: hypothetical protein K9M44_01190 [Candidatus Pacebacteria bacterium]|nr:hypothetical protein [Candidatus Paceibacterota bacterium]